MLAFAETQRSRKQFNSIAEANFSELVSMKPLISLLSLCIRKGRRDAIHSVITRHYRYHFVCLCVRMRVRVRVWTKQTENRTEFSLRCPSISKQMCINTVWQWSFECCDRF